MFDLNGCWMGVRERIQRYRTTGAAAGLARVEVLVPPADRDRILALAERLRRQHRRTGAHRPVNAEQVNDRAKLLIHRLVARRMAAEPEIIDRARESLGTLRAAGNAGEDIREWEVLLARDPTEIRRMITGRSEEMRRLRLTSPFFRAAGVEDPALRRRIWRMARRGLAGNGA